ncbi:MAG TPA: tetratricopeptide repeat protein [Flavobacteriales bacterium]|nr:tetratricopeptide repeat protein [Flavobacteriales bacterium]
MNAKKLLSLFLFLVCTFVSSAQSLDSLTRVIKKQKKEEYLQTLRRIAVSYTDLGKFDTAIVLVDKGIRYAKKIDNEIYVAKLLNTRGVVYWNKGEFTKAIAILKQGLKMAERLNDKQTIADLNNNIGLVYWDNGEYPAALKHLEKSLDQFYTIGDTSGLASSNLNIGLIYDDLNDFDNALKYYKKSLEIFKQLNDPDGISQCYGNLGSLMDELKKKEEAMDYYVKALQIAEKLKNKRQMALMNNNIGALLFNQKKKDESLGFYKNALGLYKEINDQAGLVLVLNNLGDIYGDKKMYKEALACLEQVEQIASSSDMLDHLATAYDAIAQISAETGDYKKAYLYQAMHKEIEDTLFARKSSLSLNNLKTAFEVKQKEKELNDKAEAEKKQQRIIMIAIIAGLILTLVFSAFLYKRIKLSLKQNKIIQEQKHLVEEKNKEITDSINYAKRIQHSVITSENYLKQHLHEFFVLFIPKDIVAGDFYWALDTPKGFLMATADCTGHGVPGAFMSVMGINFLNEITIERKILQPDLILNELRRGIIKTMNPEGRIEEGKDGMDISLYLLNKETLELTYSAANNPIWIVNENGVTELNPDKMPVGKYHSKENDPFTMHSVKLNKGDMIYSFTDGFPDQFGGPKGKKFKYSSLKTICAENHSVHAGEQEKRFRQAFESWKGTYEQTDDVCVIGVRA